MVTPRTGQAPPTLSHDEFVVRFRKAFDDPAYGPVEPALRDVERVAWEAYDQGRKAPRSRPAGPGFADPAYDLSDEWRATRDALLAAQARQADPAGRSRVLLVCGSPRNDGTCPGEISKSWRLAGIAQGALEDAGLEVELLDLSRVTSDYRRHIHPCKGCVSTAMPLCHWPCSCYPNHSLGQTGDWMADIYESWVAAHGVMLLTPVHWYQSPSVLKLMIDRLVCADGGNPDPTSTQGKKAEIAKQVELDGWDFPKHLAGRAYGLVVHGDVQGVLEVRRGLSDWLDWMGLIAAGERGRLDRFIGYYEPYATSHEALDRDSAVQEETRQAAEALANTVTALRTGRWQRPDSEIKAARAK